MHLARVGTLAPVGISAEEVLVEVAARPGLSSLTIVGLAGRALEESKERIRLSLRTLGVTLPSTSIVVNLAPAVLAKDGTHYDLPIALALLLAIEEIPADSLPKDAYVAGELGLGGELRPIRHAVTFAIVARQRQRPLLLPQAVEAEARLVTGVALAAATDLVSLVTSLRQRSLVFRKETPIESGGAERSRTPDSPDSSETHSEMKLDDILGQSLAKRAAIIAAAGGHNLLLTGPPGVGKSLLAQTVAGLLPPLTASERLACTAVYSTAGLLSPEKPVVAARPFRSPHHTASAVAVIGGGTRLRPGEVSLAHRGILFFDELPHFARPVLEALREPLENGTVTISRATGTVRLPARFMFIGAFNPCPCGYFGDHRHQCRCTPQQINLYRAKLSGPIVDRCSIFVRCGGVEQLASGKTGEHVRAQEQIARARQKQRARQESRLNAHLETAVVRQTLADSRLTTLAEEYLTTLSLSVRGLFNAGRVAQTIADLEDRPLTPEHLVEAISLLPPSNLAEAT